MLFASRLSEKVSCCGGQLARADPLRPRCDLVFETIAACIVFIVLFSLSTGLQRVRFAAAGSWQGRIPFGHDGFQVLLTIYIVRSVFYWCTCC